ncbi:MAG: xanthine dehydrogenase, molybdenum binding subunit apoprotein [Phenylobacterium sp.]|nr:xanthine dehydrogenase, molybdenum binding subunit apoprotein [Phenylobacterium sp.]
MADDAGRLIGKPAVRVDGKIKVTGVARYPSDEPVLHPAYAYLVTSAIAKGRVRGMNLDAARATLGVLDILNHQNVNGQVQPLLGPDGKATTTSMDGDRVWSDGQIVAVVLAETYEAAREAAYKVVVDYDVEKPSATFDSPGADAQRKVENDPKVGDAAAAFASAPVKIDERYSTPTQHHNPMELFATTCVWDGAKLTVYEATQNIYGLRGSVARQLSIDPSTVLTVSHYCGGGFGSKGPANPRTAWIALAAKRLRRPVKLVATRPQGFTTTTYRAETRHHVQLGATRDGKLTALVHEGWEVASRPSSYTVSGTQCTALVYACPNVTTAINVVHVDRSTAGYMRGPPTTPYMFALESAIDELAYALNMDPIELRRINDTQVDPILGMAFSSRSLMKCLDAAAARFGWSRRTPAPGSMREGDWLIGWGCAASTYPSNIGSATVRISLTPTGKATVQMAAHEIGTGAYTTVAVVAADRLGLQVDDITVQPGESDLPPVPRAGGSNNAASTCNVVAKACEEVRSRLAMAAAQANDSAFSGADPATLRLAGRALVGPGGRREPLAKALARVTGGTLEVHGESLPEGLPPTALADLYKGTDAILRGEQRKDVRAFAFGAHFVEVRIHRQTREIRTPRAVSAFAAGTIINPFTARSQLMGGAIWGLGSALHEATEIDLPTARLVNTNFADYMVPVNADVGQVDVILVPEVDTRVNPLGIKGIGEIGIVGMNAALANAVFHATGKRIRDLPIRIEKLL